MIEDEQPLQEPGDQLRSEYRMIARDGRVLWVRDAATVIVGEDGELLMQGLMLDVTDLKRAEAEALENEERYRMLVETSQDLIWAIDLENRFTFVNDAVRRIYGYEPEAMIGRPFTDFQKPEIARRDAEVAATIPDGVIHQRYETEAAATGRVNGDPELQQRHPARRRGQHRGRHRHRSRRDRAAAHRGRRGRASTSSSSRSSTTLRS